MNDLKNLRTVKNHMIYTKENIFITIYIKFEKKCKGFFPNIFILLITWCSKLTFYWKLKWRLVEAKTRKVPCWYLHASRNSFAAYSFALQRSPTPHSLKSHSQHLSLPLLLVISSPQIIIYTYFPLEISYWKERCDNNSVTK